MAFTVTPETEARLFPTVCAVGAFAGAVGLPLFGRLEWGYPIGLFTIVGALLGMWVGLMASMIAFHFGLQLLRHIAQSKSVNPPSERSEQP